MTFSEVYERILAYWPEGLSVADGRPVSNGGWYSATLSEALSKVESRIDHKKDTWGSLMAWTMFQAFHTEAEKLCRMGSVTLSPRSVDRKIIEEKYFENLHSQEWSEELAVYRRS
jgi:hypothetical protein